MKDENCSSMTAIDCDGKKGHKGDHSSLEFRLYWSKSYVIERSKVTARIRELKKKIKAEEPDITTAVLFGTAIEELEKLLEE